MVEKNVALKGNYRVKEMKVSSTEVLILPDLESSDPGLLNMSGVHDSAKRKRNTLLELSYATLRKNLQLPSPRFFLFFCTLIAEHFKRPSDEV